MTDLGSTSGATSSKPEGESLILRPPPDHPDRLGLSDEVHARPSEALQSPCRVTYVAVLIDTSDRMREFEHLRALCESRGILPPSKDANHFTADIGTLRLKWERHSEFSGYTFVTAGQSPQPFSDPPTRRLPAGWLESVPGKTIFAAHAKIVTETEVPGSTWLARYFGDQIIVGADIGNGAGHAYTDFRVRSDGFMRFVLLDRGFTTRQCGRMIQRLFEIEAYRMMALLALPLVGPVSTEMASAEKLLAELTVNLASPGVDNDEALLQRLTKLAAEVQACVTKTQFRFDACRAYHALIQNRIAELRESRLEGIQPIGEFMSRRFSPAVATCASIAQRLRELSERVAEASSLLSTRVDIAREQQNQRLLESMNVRAERQYRLQQAVEGLSIAAIVYYSAGLVGYLAKALKGVGFSIDAEVTEGAAVPVLAILCVFALHRTRRRIASLPESRH